MGTHFYASPEQRVELAGGSVYDYRSDMYSLGVLIFEMWYPFPTDAIRDNALLQLTQSFQLPTAFCKKFGEVAKWVARLCAKDMKARPSCDDILASSWILNYQLGFVGEACLLCNRTTESQNSSSTHNNDSHEREQRIHAEE